MCLLHGCVRDSKTLVIIMVSIYPDEIMCKYADTLLLFALMARVGGRKKLDPAEQPTTPALTTRRPRTSSTKNAFEISPCFRL